MIDNNNFLLGNPDPILESGKEIPDPNVNSRGYRAPEFADVDWGNSIVMFGCSLVYGTGLDHDKTIAAHLEAFLGRPVINMGVPSSSIAYSYTNQLALAEQGIVPYAVINCWTTILRLTYFTEKNFSEHLGPWVEDNKFGRMLFDLWNFQHYNSETYANILRKSAKLLWKDTRYLEYSFFQSSVKAFNIKRLMQIDFGSDNSHPGQRTAFATAKIIAEDLERR